MYLNKLKSEINDLKREKQILEETIKKETAEKMRLKTELIKNGNEKCNSYSNNGNSNVNGNNNTNNTTKSSTTTITSSNNIMSPT